MEERKKSNKGKKQLKVSFDKIRGTSKETLGGTTLVLGTPTL
jgi:hypothetical protein